MGDEVTSHRQTALDCATRIANTLLMNSQTDAQGIAEKIIATADKFAAWLGPDPVKQSRHSLKNQAWFSLPLFYI